MKIKILDKNGITLNTKNTICYEDIDIVLDESIYGGITPSGTINITSNGIVDVTNYASANVNVLVSSGSSTEDMLQTRVNATNSCAYLLYKFKGTNVDFLANLDTSQVTNMEYMCYENSYITSVPNLDTSNVTSLYSTYYMCDQLKTLYKHNTNKVTNLNRTFYACSELLVIDISYFNISSTSNTNSMAKNCYLLKAFVIRGFGSNNALNENAFDSCFYMLGQQDTTYNPNGEQGYVYVPRNMVATLQSATNWSVLQFRALEDYTLDGTITGDLDWAKVNGTAGQ